MRRKSLAVPALTAILLIAGLVAGYQVWRQRGIPFVGEKEQWTIGIYSAHDPFAFDGRERWFNPILTAEDVSDVPAEFVADPFLMRDGPTWHLFFEVYNRATSQGDLAVATSTNTRQWEYQQVILDEPFHLSYPYVFAWEGEYYMIPESFEANSVRLYRAVEYPIQWEFVTTLLEGRDYVDNSIVYFRGKWWLFSSVTSNATLHLAYADHLTGPYVEHPASPIVDGNPHKARPSGRLLIYNDRLYRYTMDVDPPVGTHLVWAYEVTAISPTSYSEELARDYPVIAPSGSGWNEQAMHQIDPVQVGPTDWIAAVDGYGTYLVFGWNH